MKKEKDLFFYPIFCRKVNWLVILLPVGFCIPCAVTYTVHYSISNKSWLRTGIILNPYPLLAYIFPCVSRRFRHGSFLVTLRTYDVTRNTLDVNWRSAITLLPCQLDFHWYLSSSSQSHSCHTYEVRTRQIMKPRYCATAYGILIRT